MVTEKLIVVRLKRCFGELQSLLLQLCTFPPPPLSPLAAEESNAERCIIVFQNIPLLCHPSLCLFVLLNAVKNLFDLWSLGPQPSPGRGGPQFGRCSQSAVFGPRKNSRETVRAAAPVEVFLQRLRALSLRRLHACGVPPPGRRRENFHGLRLSLRGRNDRISEIRLRAAQPVIENPTCCRAQRTGKPYARRLLSSGNTRVLEKSKFDPYTLDAEEGALLQA